MPKSETSDVSINFSPLSTGLTTMPDDKKTGSSNVEEDNAQAENPVFPIVYKPNMSELGLFGTKYREGMIYETRKVR